MAARESVLKIKVTPEERQQIEDLARRRGYDAPEDYLLALVKLDAAVQNEYNLDTKEGIMAALRESFHQAVTGNTRPVSELWDALNSYGLPTSLYPGGRPEGRPYKPISHL